MQITMFFIVIVLLNLFAGESCRKEAKMVMGNAREIFYQFNNGTVSPEYQRNFTVTLNKADAQLRFQAYGKKPAEKTIKTGDAIFF
jgi:hypothetical protein